ncbi:hypothetical protein AQI88_08345 [Streptomyces cellostaticus]|uniref:Uncharacterized protein n=1 Tax=Streptomyces cellostaticus TaxID=67285 RepID=A0A101NPY6_9ACTN|nr:insulinase family protein [Streptomyces cellostaticus]KUM97275.1 hypothetical protein AQI88_08345 [Streptomyces cellostaticus]
MTSLFGSPDRLHQLQVGRHLFVGHPCSGIAGGDPDQLPGLTIEEVRAYHRSHYLPSNALFFLYGSLDEPTALSTLAAALAEGQAGDAPPHPVPADQGPQRAVVRASGGRAGVAGVAWALPGSQDPATRFATRVLARALADPASGLVYERLSDVGSAGRQPALQLHGCRPVLGCAVGDVVEDRLDVVERTVTGTMAQVAEEGLPASVLLRACSRVELALREPRAGGGGAGRALFDRVLTTWPYGGDPLAELCLKDAAATVRSWCEKPQGRMTDLVHDWLSGNQHRITLLTLPGPAPRHRPTGAPGTRRLPGAPRRRHALPLPADTAAGRATLVPQEHTTVAGAPLQHCLLPTHGLAYLDIALPLAPVPRELLPLVPVWCAAVARAAEHLAADSGVRVRHTFHPGSAASGGPLAVLRARCLLQDVDTLADTLASALCQDATDAAAQTAAASHRTGLRALRGPQIHRLVDIRLFSGVDVAGRLADVVHGEEAWDRLTGSPVRGVQVTAVRDLLLAGGNVFLGLTTAADGPVRRAWSAVERMTELLLRHRSALAPPPATTGWTASGRPRLEVLAMPAPLHTVGCLLVPSAGAVTPEHHAVAGYLTGGPLTESVRERGGAYAGLMDADDLRGTLRLLSLRDPRDSATLGDFLRLGAQLAKSRPSKEVIRQAVLGAVKQVFPGSTAAEAGYAAREDWLAGRCEQDAATRRERLLSTGPEHFAEVAALLDRLVNEATFVVHAHPDTAAGTEHRLRHTLASA